MYKFGLIAAIWLGTRKTEGFLPGLGSVRGDDGVNSQLVGQILERLHGRRFHLVIVCHCALRV